MKLNKILLAVGIIISLVIVYWIGYILGSNIQKEPNNTNEVKEESKEEIMSKMIGEWGTCEDYNCHGIIISINKEQDYTFLPYIMWSEAEPAGIIKEVSKLSNDEYKLKIYYETFETEELSRPEQTVEIIANTSERKESILKINDTKYEYITGDIEAFYSSKIS